MNSYLNQYLRGLLLVLASSGFGALSLQAQGKRVKVVTYIDDVQDERRSTRWTLTEWLRIKERMKMMDVWLAMFSDPAKDKFAPELSLTYSRAGGMSQFSLGVPEIFNEEQQEIDSRHLMESGRVQFWFTNLVSASTGLRTLDIDLGLEGQLSKRSFTHDQEMVSPVDASVFSLQENKLTTAGINLRLFGANSQDSTLVAKAGKFELDTGYDLEGLRKSEGQYVGGEMALYFMKWLGAEGHYLQLKPQGNAVWKGKGSQAEYGGFLEIYNFRIGYGSYRRDWSFESEGTRLDSSEKGNAFFMRLYF